MSKLKATKGPWYVRKWAGDEWPEKRISIGPMSDGIATAVAISPRHAEEKQMSYNAHLMSAAHELYESNQELAQHVIELCAVMGVPVPQASIDRHNEASAKARGES